MKFRRRSGFHYVPPCGQNQGTDQFGVQGPCAVGVQDNATVNGQGQIQVNPAQVSKYRFSHELKYISYTMYNIPWWCCSFISYIFYQSLP